MYIKEIGAPVKFAVESIGKTLSPSARLLSPAGFISSRSVFGADEGVTGIPRSLRSFG